MILLRSKELDAADRMSLGPKGSYRREAFRAHSGHIRRTAGTRTGSRYGWGVPKLSTDGGVLTDPVVGNLK